MFCLLPIPSVVTKDLQGLLLVTGNVLPLGSLHILRPLIVVPHLLRKTKGLGGLLSGGGQVRPILILVLPIPGGGIPTQFGGGSLLLLRQILVPVLLNVGPLLGVPLVFGPAEGFGRLAGLERELGPLKIQEVRILVGKFAVIVVGRVKGCVRGIRAIDTWCQCNSSQL